MALTRKGPLKPLLEVRIPLLVPAHYGGSLAVADRQKLLSAGQGPNPCREKFLGKVPHRETSRNPPHQRDLSAEAVIHGQGGKRHGLQFLAGGPISGSGWDLLVEPLGQPSGLPVVLVRLGQDYSLVLGVEEDLAMHTSLFMPSKMWNFRRTEVA